MSNSDQNLQKALLLTIILAFCFIPVFCSETRNDDMEVTFIHDIQGRGAISPEAGKQHKIEGVVSAVFHDNNCGILGFFMQEEQTDFDDDELTSEGIFIFDEGVNRELTRGDIVRVVGVVQEFNGSTELRNITSLEILRNAPEELVPRELTLPFSEGFAQERFEGMLISSQQSFVITDTSKIGRFGEVSLATARLWNPTDVVNPGEEAVDLQNINALHRIILDDGSTMENPEPILFPPPELTMDNYLRSGDLVSGVLGILAYNWSGTDATWDYRIYPVDTLVFTRDNPRDNIPENDSQSLRVVSFNVKNYFNGPDFPTERGADTTSEFGRQRAKVISALVALDGDIVCLQEMQNNGFDADGSLNDLLSGLNARFSGERLMEMINPGTGRLGSDAIMVAIIYDAMRVFPLGEPAYNTIGAFEYKNRPPLAQTFRFNGNNEVLTVVVNHFKSKGCSNATGLDTDQGDGQGCWNQTRVDAAIQLLEWLNSDPTQSNDPDILIVGDFNAGILEDPIRYMEDNTYHHLLKTFSEEIYSYIYQGQSSCLDHALVSSSLLEHVTDAGIWHINADEPSVFDYNEEYKSAAQREKFYSSDPYRSSDHDPLFIQIF